MAAVLSSHGCYSVENILMLCGVPEEKVKLSDGESTSFSRVSEERRKISIQIHTFIPSYSEFYYYPGIFRIYDI